MLIEFLRDSELILGVYISLITFLSLSTFLSPISPNLPHLTLSLYLFPHLPSSPSPYPHQLSAMVKRLHEQLEVKGRELSEFKEKYGIRFQGEEEKERDSKPSSDSKAQGVLVS